MPLARIVSLLVRYRLTILLLFLFFLENSLIAQVGSSSAGSSASTSIPTSVSGQVINAITGLPIARALVRFNDRAILTDHDGKFEFDQNTEANGNMLVIKPGFSASSDPSDSPNIYLQGGQLASPVRLLLYPEALLTGTVVAPDGTPLQGIFVGARKSINDESGHRVVPIAPTQTDSHGNFRLAVAAGNYRLETQYVAKDITTGLAILPLTSPAQTSSGPSNGIQLRSGEEQHFELRPLTSSTHSVTVATDSSSQRGLGSVQISAHSSNGSLLQLSPSFNSLTGEIKIELPRGSYTLTARRNNPGSFEQAETTVTVPDHDISGIVLQFSPIPAIPVEMLIDESATSDNARPALTQFNLALEKEQPEFEQDTATIRLTPLSNNQSFSFTAPPGRYRLRAHSNGEWFIQSVSAGTTDLLEQGLVVAPGSAGTPIRVMVSNQSGSLQGNVNLNGTPCAGWVYLIATTPNAQPILSIHSSVDGGYLIAHVPPGGYLVVAFERRHSINYEDSTSLTPFSSHVRSITISAGDKATLKLDAVSNEELIP